jgi:L-ascorbate metabolism protein UlaG (beta-lactamase superfamily)
MVITHHGGQSFKLTLSDTTIAYNPISKSNKSKLPVTKYGADVAFVSLWHADFNGIAEVTHGQKAPFVIDTPGEYEVGAVTARGFAVPTTYDGVEAFNTVYQVQFDGLNIVLLGVLGSPEIDPKILGELGDIDVLFVPIGGGDVLEVPQASKLAVKLEARLVIPTHYDSASLTAFLKEESKDGLKPVDKLTIKRRDVADMNGEVVVLAAK